MMVFSNDMKWVSFADQPCCNDRERAAVSKPCVVHSEELSIKKNMSIRPRGTGEERHLPSEEILAKLAYKNVADQ